MAGPSGTLICVCFSILTLARQSCGRAAGRLVPHQCHGTGVGSKLSCEFRLFGSRDAIGVGPLGRG
jgi:hypothetical protein